MRLLLFAAALLVVPTVVAVEPGGGPPVPWLLQGTVRVLDAGETLPCAEPSSATLYTWVQWWSANFQLSVAGGCDTIVTDFFGVGDIWEGWELDDLVLGSGTSGRVGAFDAPAVPLDLTQTLADGRTVRIVGEFVVVF